MPKRKAYWLRFEHDRSYTSKTCWQLLDHKSGKMLAQVYTRSGDSWLAKIGDFTNFRRVKSDSTMGTNAHWSRVAEAKRYVKEELGVSIFSAPVDSNNGCPGNT